MYSCTVFIPRMLWPTWQSMLLPHTTYEWKTSPICLLKYLQKLKSKNPSVQQVAIKSIKYQTWKISWQSLTLQNKGSFVNSASWGFHLKTRSKNYGFVSIFIIYKQLLVHSSFGWFNTVVLNISCCFVMRNVYND